MKRVIPCLYAEYGRHIDEARAIPSYLDCLKPVERRLLYTLHHTARKKFVKAARVIGDCFKYHPHGDQALFESLVQLVTVRNFAVGQGNWGYINLDKLKAAKMRYPEVKANSLLDEFIFEFEKFIPMDDPENLGELQPIFLPGIVPVGLIGEHIIQGIGFHTTKMPQYSLSDLITRLLWLLKKKANVIEPEPIIIPKIRDCNVYESTPGTFTDILTTGIGTIIVVPIMKVIKNTIEIRGKIPTGISSIKNNREKYNYSIIDLSSADDGFRIIIEPTLGMVNQQFINNIHETIKTNIAILCNVVDKNKTITTMGIDELLIHSYEAWFQIYYNKCASDKEALEEKLFQNYVISIIREIIEKNNVKSITDIITIFKNDYSINHPTVTEDHISHTCSRNTIRQLVEHANDTKGINQLLIDKITEISNLNLKALERMNAYL